MECALDMWNGCQCIWQRFIVFARTYSGYWYMSWSWIRQEFEQGVSSGILQDMFGVVRSLMGNMEPTRYSVGARTCQFSLYSKNAFEQDMGWLMKVTWYIPSWIAAVLQKSQHFRNLCINLGLQVHKTCASIWFCECINFSTILISIYQGVFLPWCPSDNCSRHTVKWNLNSKLNFHACMWKVVTILCHFGCWVVHTSQSWHVWFYPLLK